MAESNKNQTAAERARLKEALGAQLTDHICASPNCPTPGERITMKELYPVVTLALPTLLNGFANLNTIV